MNKTVLDNGVRVVTKTVPHVRSASFGVYAPVGSRHESVRLAGASHFLEHLLFKGTSRRSAYEISAALEAVGGESNAYTTKEYTSYFARVLDSDLPLAIDIICDMVSSSVLDVREMDLERGVVLEEISMHADEAEDAVHDLFAGAVFGNHPLGRTILGTSESIGQMQRDELYEFYRTHYRPSNLVFAAAGQLDHDEVVQQVVEAISRGHAAGWGDSVDVQHQTDSGDVAEGAQAVETKDIEQTHVVIGGGGIDRHDKRRYALLVLSQVLGGGMSSRLFQEVREKRGLAYSVYTFAHRYSDTGIAGAYVGCAPSRLSEALDVVHGELALIAEKGISTEELQRGIGMVRGGTVLGLEDTGAWMERVGKGELLYGDYLSIKELIRRVEAVTVDDVHSLASELFAGPLSVATIGPGLTTNGPAGA